MKKPTDCPEELWQKFCAWWVSTGSSLEALENSPEMAGECFKTWADGYRCGRADRT